MKIWNQDNYLQDLQRIVNIDSGSIYFDGIRKVADFFGRKYEQLGLTVEILESGKAGCCLKASNFPNEDIDILMVGHMDTVFAKGTVAERPFTMDEQFAYGPGVADMKSGALLISYIVETLLCDCPKLHICVAYNGDEETGSVYSKEWLQALAKKSRYCMVFEPGRLNGTFVSKRKGSSEYKITFHGIAAHAGIEPEKGANAIVEMAHWISELAKMNNYEVGTSVNAGVVSGGTASNVVPELATCVFDIRYEDMNEFQKIRQRMNELQQNPLVEKVKVDIEETCFCAPMLETPQSAHMIDILKETANNLQIEIHFISTGGSSDANNISEVGTPVLDGCGPCGANLHSDKEYLVLDSIQQRYELLVEMIKRLHYNMPLS